MNNNINNNKKMNNEVELNNNNGEIKMNNTNIYIEEINQLKERLEELEQEKKLIENKGEITMNNEEYITEEEEQMLELEQITDITYDLVADELSNPSEELIKLLTEKATEKISNNTSIEIDEETKIFIKDMVEGALDNMI